MVRDPLSRRSLLAATVAGVTSLSGCTATGEGSCRTVFEGVETVRWDSMQIYDVEVEAGQRLYLRVRRLDGPQPIITVFDPAEETLLTAQDVDQFERVIEITESGPYAVVTRNDSTASRGRWETTVAVYRGWCSDVF